MNRFWKPAIAGVAAVALLGSVLVTSFVHAAGMSSKATIGAPAPQFTLQDENGKPVSLSAYAGKIVVLEWTNPQCPFVKRHYAAKTMINLANEYKSQDVVWLAINSTGTATNAEDKAWITENNLSYPILNDSAGEVGHAYGAKSTPGMYIIGKNGTLVYSGAIDNDPSGNLAPSAKVNYVQKALTELLAGSAVSTPQTKSYGCAVHYAK
jgi:peroxiredoxin